MPSPIVAEDVYRFRWIDHVRLSPDGERVAYQLSWADGEARQNRSRIVIRRLLEAEPVDATATPRRDHSPEWSPDGRRLAFVSRRGPADQIFVVETSSPGDARQVTFVPEAQAARSGLQTGATWPSSARLSAIPRRWWTTPARLKTGSSSGDPRSRGSPAGSITSTTVRASSTAATTIYL